MSSFLDMGGYAAFVWPAWALTAALLAWMAIASMRRLKSLERELADAEDGR
jgi:heme exporter protein D